MAFRKIQIFLTTSSIGTVAFLSGKYQERNQVIEKFEQPTTIFALAPSLSNPNHDSFSYLWNILDKLQCYSKNLQLSNFASIKAASPVAEQSALQGTSRVSQIMKYGYPGLDNVISYSDYVLSYDRRNRVAHWVFEHLTAESVKSNDQVDRAKCNFTEAEHVHPYFRSHNSDYKGSGYDRGHLAAAGNHKANQKFIQDTFYLTNMAPQVGKGFNRDSWNRLEKYVRKLTKVYSNVYCCTGPLYLPKKESNGKMYVKYEVIGAQHVAVPTHFYKVVVGETKEGVLEMECYLMENTVIDDNIPIQSFQVPLELIERSAGLLFFDSVLKTRISKINGKKS